MPPSLRHWTEVSPSRFPWEQEALAFLRAKLPDHEPWRAWTNFQFLALDGSVNEVDALVLGKLGLFLVEIKGHRGVVAGDQGTLTFETEGGERASIDHPLYLANLKAKRLKDLLRRARALQAKQLPFLEALVFLSHASELRVPPPADARLLLRDGILPALIERRAPGLPAEARAFIDKPLAKALTQALDEIGIARIPTKRRVRDYEIVETLEETAVWRDQLAKHSSIPGTFRRARRYFSEPGSPLDREAVVRAARREFQLLERLRYPDILAAKEFATDEEGAVLFFEHLPGAIRLDRYLAEHGERLSLDARLDLLRRIAEAVRHAHASRIVHRSLSPQSVLVVSGPGGDVTELRVMNWSAGARDQEGASSSGVVGPTLHPESHVELAAAVYLAPELRRDPSSTEATLDVFSLGAIAWHLLTGRPPASSSDELFERCRAGGLKLSAAIEGASRTLEELVASATDANASRRLASVDDFLAELDAVLLEENESSQPRCEIPPEAQPGERFANGLLVLRRLGAGSTAVAFLVQRGEGDFAELFVLKLARDPAHSERLQREAVLLRQLDHPHIASLVEEVELGPWRGFLTRPANTETLRQRLVTEGPLQLEMLERFGGQLLDALVHLEERGISHRDLKPDNIAITDFGRRQALGLVLFDFSLSGAPADDLDVGTLHYLDPFLGDRSRKRWDLHAERYSAALTLHEMATGVLPEWGDGKSDPRALDEEHIRLVPDRFPAGVREPLARFFDRALARSPSKRFDNAADMRDAWRAVFLGTQHPPVLEAPEHSAATLGQRTQALGIRTPLHELALSTRAANALDRLSLFTVEDLLRTPPFRLASARGVGAKTRAELEETARSLRLLFPDVPITAEQPRSTSADASAALPEHGSGTLAPASAAQAHAGVSVDELLALLRPGPRRKEEHRKAFEALLGREVALAFPTQTDAAHSLGVTAQKLQAWLEALRKHWRGSGAGTALAEDLAAIVERHHGVLSVREAAEALLALRASACAGEDALAAAAALARIATDVESLTEEPRWRLRRRDGRAWLTHEDELVRYACDLGARAVELAREDPLSGRERVEAELALVPRPAGLAALPPGRLARLAVEAAGGAIDLSGRGELYPVDLAPERALKLTLGALSTAGQPLRDEESGADLGRRLVKATEIRERVRARYPRAASLPDPPELDALLRAAGWEFEWSEAHAAYSTRVDDALTLAPSSTRWHRSRGGRAVTPDDGFEQRLHSAISARNFRVLRFHPDDFEAARAALAERFPELEVVDLDARIARALRAFLTERGIRNDSFFDADAAGPGGRGWGKVMTVMRSVLQRVTEELSAGASPLCLVNVGLLGRYELWEPIHALNPQTGARARRAALVLLPGDVTMGWADVDGKQMPILPGQLIAVPDSWLAPFRPEPAPTR